jgi:GTP-binding protein Era
MNEQITYAGTIAIIGLTNAGKSTLLNQILNTKGAIISHKVQTTRTKIIGVKTIDNTQLIFIDTPGVFNPKNQFEKKMLKTATDELSSADEIILIIDAKKGLDKKNEHLIKRLQSENRKIILVLNKVDKIKKEKLLPLIEQLNQYGIFKEIFMISALKGTNVDELINYLKNQMPKSPWLYPKDQIIDINQRIYAAEITREKVYKFLHEELPYEIHVETEQFTKKKNKTLEIHQIIFVMRESQRKIVLGQKGQMIKKIGTAARKELEELWQTKVNLFLFVKINENWKEQF